PGEGYPRLNAEAEQPGRVLNGRVAVLAALPVELIAQVVEVHVTGHGEGAGHGNAAVDLTPGVVERALADAAGNGEGAVVGKGGVLGHQALAQGGGGGGQLEGRARGVLAADGAVGQGREAPGVLEG